jgi:uncharacterized protein (TIGR02646 family)
MKYVTKGLEPPEFAAWKGSASENWKPSYRDLRGPEKALLHKSLLNEQHYVCCYCGRQIDQSNSHIEHFRPQEFESLALDYSNLHASCIKATVTFVDNEGRQLPEAIRLPLHCGHAKGDGFDETLHIAPTDEACEDRFSYYLDGAMVAAIQDDRAAAFMLELLKLDIPFLQGRRAKAIRSVFSDDFIATATVSELKQLDAGFRRADESGRLSDFAHAIARFARQLLPS